MRVFVYYNLHKKLWSVKALEGPQKGRVIRRANHVTLRDAMPKVSQKGRERVLREKRKTYTLELWVLCAHLRPVCRYHRTAG